MLTFITRNWKRILVGLVLVTAWMTFLQTDLPGTDGWRYLRALYSALTLFILGGLDVGFPEDNSYFINIVLWVCYFLAPLLMAGFLYQMVQEKILSRLSPWLNNHTIICGMGHNGQLIYDLVKQYSEKRHKIVLIESNIHNTYIKLLEEDPYTWWIKQDMTELPALLKAKIHKARRMIITTHRDIDNLNTMIQAVDLGGKRQDFMLYCHIDDLSLHENFTKTLLQEAKFAPVKLFNGYDYVARRLYYSKVKSGGYLGQEGALFVILGFGGFGQVLLHHMIMDQDRQTKDEFVIVDNNWTDPFKRFQELYAEKLTRPPQEIHPPISMDMDNPDLWEKVAGLEGAASKQMLLFVCSDNDIFNLNLAISMKRHGPEAIKRATIFCRMYASTAEELNDILEKRITKTQAKDIILFSMKIELKEAFRKELYPSVSA